MAQYRKSVVELLGEVGVRGKTWTMMEIRTECARSPVVLDAEIATCVDILQGVAQGCTPSPNFVDIS